MNIPKFSGYQILEVLPRGGMSTVYKARQLSLDRIVAIKALPPTMGVDPADVEKFMAEAKITAGLKHQNIVQVYDFGRSDDGVYYFVMEYISGYSVAAWIKRKRFLSEENSLLCALGIAAAMSYAWKKSGVVHCDIKPDNVVIDGDGTVKVADLGLAMSVKSILGQVRSKDSPVFGTPNYISPEQSRGEEHLDCRADVYSLGAMLYHCMTGTMPFEGFPPLEVMDRQITDQIPDPQDLNRSISVWSACLIEKMMAKDRNCRQQDWTEAIRDLSNARSEMMPQSILPPEIASTIKRSAMREKLVQEVCRPEVIINSSRPPVFRADRSPFIKKLLATGLWRKIVISAAGVAFLLTLVFGIRGLLKDMKTKTGLGTGPVSLTNGSQSHESDRSVSGLASQDVPDDREVKAFEKHKQITAWLKANPAGLSEAVARFNKLASETAGTKYSDVARQEAEKLQKALAEIKIIMATLEKTANGYAAQKHFLEAAAVYEKYHGPCDSETAGERRRKALVFHEKQTARLENERILNRQTAEQQLLHAADEIAMIIVDDDIGAALCRVKEISSDLPLIAAIPEYENMTATLKKSTAVERLILDSFRMQKDQEVSIAFLNGTQRLFIRDVRGDLVIAEDVWKKEQGTIVLRRNFALKDLALSEKTERIGTGEGEELALMRVVLALQAGHYQQASEAAVKTGPLFSKSLNEAIAARSKSVNTWRVFQALTRVFSLAGIYSGDSLPEPKTCLDAIRNGRQLLQQGPALNKVVGQFRARFGYTEMAQLYDPVLEAMIDTNLSAQSRAAALPAPGKSGEDAKSPLNMTEAFVAKMIELNSGLREDQLTFQADDSKRIVSVEVISMHLRDLKAIENLVDLQQLTCAGARYNVILEPTVIAPLSDLTPLKKMSLRDLTLNYTRVKDISTLSRMPLSFLNLAYTKVSDLHPLKGMPLKYLDVSFTPVHDIRPLAGLALAGLNISGTGVADLAPLSAMPLARLSAAFTRVKDLTPLHNMPLRVLELRNTEVTDIAPLKGLSLEYLDLADTAVRDISALRGMSLRELDLRKTKVKYLDGLEQMPIEILKINGTGIRDISLLKNMPLKSLDLRNTGITDLSPIKNSLIEEIWLDDLVNQQNLDKVRAILAVLQTMPRLKSVNGQLVQEWSSRSLR